MFCALNYEGDGIIREIRLAGLFHSGMNGASKGPASSTLAVHTIAAYSLVIALTPESWALYIPTLLDVIAPMNALSNLANQLTITGQCTHRQTQTTLVRNRVLQSPCLDSALKAHWHRAKRQNMDIRKRVAGPAMASVFAGEILQILSNLILNSLDALPESEPVLCIRVRTSQGKVHITIADNGSGIESSICQNMFQPHRTTKSHGTGLGLWLSRKIVEKHSGTISCRSSRQPGRSGTTFRLSLPTSFAQQNHAAYLQQPA
jgi:signal transduction histidine kinase